MSDVQITLGGQSDAQITATVPGIQGPVGVGFPSGGTANQVLFKQSSTSYDAVWGFITSAMIGDLQIVDADVSASAAIAGTKISPNFGSQNVVTTGTSTAASFIPTSSTAPTNGVYLPAANSVSVATNSTERLRFDSTGQIEAVSLGTAAAPVFSFTGDPNTGIYSPGADQVAISTAGSGRLFVDASGFVGLGTTPTVPLHIKGGAANPSAIIHLQPANNTVSNYITFSNATNNARGYFEYNYTNDSLTIATAASPRLTITSDGKLGVGTSSPAMILDARTNVTGLPATTGTTQTNGVVRIASTATTGCIDIGSNSGAPWIQSTDRTDLSQKYSLLLNPNGGSVGIGTSAPAYGLEVNNQNIAITNRPSTGTDNPVLYLRRNVESGDASIVGTHGTLAFQTDYLVNGTFATSSSILAGSATGDNINTYFAFSTTNSGGTLGERMRLTSAGLGIGSTAPTQLLTIRGANFTGSSFNGQAIEDPNAERIRVGYKDGSLDTGLVPAQIVQINASELAIASRDVSTSAIRFHTGTGVPERARIDSSGNFGVGVTSPATASFGNVIRNKAGAGLGAAGYFAEGANSDTWFGIYSGTGTSDSAALVYPSTGSLRIATTTGVGVGGFSEKIRITSTGQLSHIGAGTSGSPAVSFNGSAPSNSIVVDSSGNLGIGTASPGYKLDIASDATGSALRLRGGSGGSSTLQFTDNAISAQWGTIVTTASSLDIGHSGIVRLSTGGTERMRITSDAYVRLASGTGGIQFNGDTAAANALDDYEEGTWTVNFYDAGTGGNVSATSTTGTYTKVGRFVHLQFDANNINTAGLTSANTLFFSIPFVGLASPFQEYNGACAIAGSSSATTPAISHLVSNSARAYFLVNNIASGAFVNLLVSSITSGANGFRVSLSYMA